MLQQQCCEPHRLVAELGADGGFRGRAVVTLVEQQIECAVNGRKSRREVGHRSNVEQPLGRREQFFRARYPFSIAAWLLTKALAISFTLKPHRMLRMSATCTSSAKRGWQQENIMRRRSSLIAFAVKSSSTAGTSVHSLSSSRRSSGAKVRAVRWRRKMSNARFFAVA